MRDIVVSGLSDLQSALQVAQEEVVIVVIVHCCCYFWKYTTLRYATLRYNTATMIGISTNQTNKLAIHEWIGKEIRNNSCCGFCCCCLRVCNVLLSVYGKTSKMKITLLLYVWYIWYVF